MSAEAGETTVHAQSEARAVELKTGVRADPLFDEWLLPVASPALLARFPDRDPDELAGLPLPERLFE